MAFVKLGDVTRKSFMLIGQCVPCVKQNASRIKVKRLVLDTNLNAFFKEDEYYHAIDTEKVCKPGDVVLIQELPEKITKLITHKIVEIIHPFGDVTDPVTGKKVVVSVYRDQLEKEKELYGKVDSAFDYDSAPPRGWQEGKRDFSDKPTYVKYHQFPEDDPYSIQ